jgi:glucosamine--fructose-6-phosphate aminotransferase (isomerizing)
VTVTEREIREQPRAWQWVLGEIPQRLQAVKPSLGAREVVFCGCGSAYHVAISCAASFRASGLQGRAETSGEASLFDDPARPWTGRALVAASRSGETSETIWALRRARAQGAEAVAMTCEAESSLACEAPLSLLLEECGERSVVTTKSVTSMMLAGQIAARVLSGSAHPQKPLEALPQACQRALDAAGPLVEKAWAGEGFAHCAFLGSGPLWGAANEARLKMQEMALVPSESFPVLEFRHGPMAQAGKEMLVVALLSQAAREREIAVLRQLAGLGATIFAICEAADAELREATPFVLELGSGLPDHLRQPLYLPPAHLLALRAAMSRGLDPDSPQNLSRAVIL